MPSKLPAQVKVNQLSYTLAIKRMMGKPASVAEIVEATGMSDRTVWGLVKVLRRHKVIYVAEWRKDALQRWTIAGYCVGALPDKPKPKRTPEEIQQMLRASARKRYEKKQASTPSPEALAAANLFRV